MDKLVGILTLLNDFVQNAMPRPIPYTLESFNEYNREQTIIDLCGDYAYSLERCKAFDLA
jgi:hypothetical protein